MSTALNYLEEIENFEEELQSFQVKTKDEAMWCMRKLKKLFDEKQENEEAVKIEIERLNQWLEAENGKLERGIKFFTALLEDYHRQELEKDPKKKTIKLPLGTLQLRAQQPEFERDEEKLLAWLKKKKLKDFIEKIEKPKWSELKKAAQVIDNNVVYNGEIVDGITVTPKEPKFTVKLNGDESNGTI